ncbi:MAG: type II toxin-antitoxin system HicA family toxin [Coprococcus sp.]
MPLTEKIFQDIMNGTKDKNIRFSELLKLLNALGFNCRIKGDHFVYYKSGIEEIINIQPDGNKAKPYQIKQIRMIIQKYNLEV